MKSPALSIIVPVYKVEHYLKECIDSILNQSFKDFELILVDDGSPDKSGEICDSYIAKDYRIKVIHKSNGGVSSARNSGISQAKGVWITFIDADDLILPTFIAALYSPIAEGHDIELVQGGCQNYEAGKITGIEQQYDSLISNEPGLLFTKFRGLTISKLFKNSILNDTPALRFDEKMSIAEDMAFTLDYILRIKKFAFVDETGYLYRRDNHTSAVHIPRPANYEIELHSFQHLFSSTLCFIKKHNLKSEDSELRLRQRGEQLINLIKTIYSQYDTRRERLSRLSNDISAEQYKTINHIKGRDKLLFLPFRSSARSIYDFLFKIIFYLFAKKR